MPKPPPAPSVEAAFNEQRAAIRALLTRATLDDIATRYQVGLRLLLLKRNPDKYGERAVERLSADLGVGTATLYRYCLVAETWTGPDVQALLGRTTELGEPLTWSHLVVLARAPASARGSLVYQCLRQRWSVRDLTVRVQELTARDTDDSDALEDDDDEAPIRAALTEGIEHASRASIQVGVFMEALEDRLRDHARDSPLLPRAIATFRELRAKTDAALESMEQASRESETRIKVAAPVARGKLGRG